jgi:hypothetical protein
MNTKLYVTSFAYDMYQVSGKQLIQSFINTRTEGILLVCHENFDLSYTEDNILCYKLNESQFLKKWLRKNKDIIPRELGGQANRIQQPHVYFNEWNRKASRWFRKIASLEYALQQYKDEYDSIIWLDSDCLIKQRITTSFINNIFNETGVFYHYGNYRLTHNMGVESSVIGFNKQYDGYSFLKDVIEYFRTGHFRQLPRWDDGWIFKIMIETNKYKTRDLIYNSRKNAVIHVGPFSEYIIHDKGLHKRLNILI